MSSARRVRLPITDAGELLAALERLDERGRAVLEMRYGLAGTRLHNLREIAKRLAISRENVRQLEARAIESLDAAAAPCIPDAAQTAANAPVGASHKALVARWTLMLLALRPAHAYELRKRLAESGIPPVSYRNLYEMEAEGLVSSKWAPGAHAGANRRVYTMTARGRERLKTERQALEKVAATVIAFLAEGCE